MGSVLSSLAKLGQVLLSSWGQEHTLPGSPQGRDLEGVSYPGSRAEASKQDERGNQKLPYCQRVRRWSRTGKELRATPSHGDGREAVDGRRNEPLFPLGSLWCLRTVKLHSP